MRFDMITHVPGASFAIVRAARAVLLGCPLDACSDRAGTREEALRIVMGLAAQIKKPTYEKIWIEFSAGAYADTKLWISTAEIAAVAEQLKGKNHVFA